MARKLVCVAGIVAALWLGSCTAVSPFATPPGDYGRPAVVRGFARGGTYLGTVVGVVAAVVLWLPGKAVGMVVDEPFGFSPKEWPFVPMTACATAGHWVVGAPVEGVHWLCWGAWVDREEPLKFGEVAEGAVPVGERRE